MANRIDCLGNRINVQVDNDSAARLGSGKGASFDPTVNRFRMDAQYLGGLGDGLRLRLQARYPLL